MIKNKLISVIVPVYNVKPYLEQCVESVLRQTYTQTEILLVDDGSTDGCSQVCDDFAGKDKRVRVFHTENKGLSAARNVGLEQAVGDYISFLDGDDWMEPSALWELENAARQHDADIVVCERYIELVGKVICSPRKSDKAVFCGQDILTAYADGLFYEFAWNKLYRRNLFSGLRFPEGRNYEDILVNCTLMKTLSENEGTVVRVPRELVHFRLRKSSISHTHSLKNITDRFFAFRERYEKLTGFHTAFLQKCFLAIGLLWSSYCSFSKEERKAANNLLGETKAFSKQHFRRVIFGKYSFRAKLFCLLSQIKAPVFVLTVSKVLALWKRCRYKKRVLFE